MSDDPQHFILATAGHVDHGKSALVRALTGTDPDRLPEERRRGISIELGFAEMTLEAASRRLSIGVIDVPGHEDFVKTMAAGVFTADAALIVVAANEGPKPQTREHLAILGFAGVGRAVVALTKVDLVQQTEAVARAVNDLLRDTPFRSAPIVPVSVYDASSLARLKATLADLLIRVRSPLDIGKPRLWVDRAFNDRGVGTIVTGTLSGGALARDQSVVIRPTGQCARIRSLHNHGRALRSAAAHMRVALNLPEVTIKPDDPLAVTRGQMVTTLDVGVITGLIDVHLIHSSLLPAPRWRDGLAVNVLIGSGRVAARARRFQDEAFVRLRLSSPMSVMIGDRLVLRSAADQSTLAGGIVLDASPPTPRRWRNSVDQILLLRDRAIDPTDVRTIVTTALRRDRMIDADALRCALLVADDTLRRCMDELEREGQVRRVGRNVMTAAFFGEMAQTLSTAIDVFHDHQPQRTGLPLAEARALLQSCLPRRLGVGVDEVLVTVLKNAPAISFERSGNVLRRIGFRPALPPRLHRAGERLREQLKRDGLAPPSSAQLATGDADWEALRFLIANGEVISLGEVVLAMDAYVSAVSVIRTYLASHPPASVADLKTLLKTTRRVMVPLLERLDRDGITRRTGDLRTLPPAS